MKFDLYIVETFFLRKDLKRISLVEQEKRDPQISEKDLKEIYQKSCSDCWSMMMMVGKSPAEKTLNASSHWKVSDIFYLITIKYTLTSLRIRLKIAKKVRL